MKNNTNPEIDNKTPEDIVKEIQNGNGELIPLLWDKVHDFIAMKANDYINGFNSNMAYLKEDCINESYFGFIKAVNDYDPAKGCTFVSYLSYCIQNDFTTAIYCGRSERYKREPINNYISLETPLSNADDDLTLIDTIADKNSMACYRNLENKTFWNDVRKVINIAINKCDSAYGKEVMKYMLKHDCNMREAVRCCFPEEQNKAYYEATKTKKELKRLLSRRDIKQALCEIGMEEYILYKSTGVKAYKRRNFTSTTEYGALTRIEDKGYTFNDLCEILNKES